MDPRLMEVLKKAKQVDKAAEQFDSVPNKQQVLGQRKTSNSGGGLFDQVNITEDGGGVSTMKYKPGSDEYTSAVDNSPLPDAIKEAMKKNPIQQPDMMGIDVDEDVIREIRGGEYTEEDEYDFLSEDRQPKPRTRKSGVRNKQIVETPNYGSGLGEEDIRRMIAEEISRVLPNIVERYFNQKLVSENVKILRKIKKR